MWSRYLKVELRFVKARGFIFLRSLTKRKESKLRAHSELERDEGLRGHRWAIKGGVGGD